jgi:hypothetical protein
MAFDKAALLADLEQTGVDMTQATAGGGDYVPPAEGITQLRFFAYIEYGKHTKTIKGKPPKTSERVRLGFELHGPNHPPQESGMPHVIWIDESKSLNEKANFFKLFSRMNHAGKVKHIVGLLGEAYLGTVTHRKYKRADGSEGVAAELRKKGEPYDIRPTSFQNPGTGQVENIAVPAAKNEERLFLWDRPTVEQWASIFIDGEYEARKNAAGEVTKPASSKNVDQARVKSANNFKGSPIELLLLANGQSLDIPNAELGGADDSDDDHDVTADVGSKAPVQPASVPTGQAAADALSGIVG